MADRKRTDWIDRTIDEVNRTITFVHVRQLPEEDKPTSIGEPLVFHEALLSNENRAYAVLHGMNARIGDTMAQAAGTDIAKKMDAGRLLVEHFESGSPEWNIKGSRKPVDTEALLTKLLANDPEKLAAIIAAAQAAIAAKADNATG